MIRRIVAETLGQTHVFGENPHRYCQNPKSFAGIVIIGRHHLLTGILIDHHIFTVFAIMGTQIQHLFGCPLDIGQLSQIRDITGYLMNRTHPLAMGLKGQLPQAGAAFQFLVQINFTLPGGYHQGGLGGIPQNIPMVYFRGWW